MRSYIDWFIAECISDWQIIMQQVQRYSKIPFVTLCVSILLESRPFLLLQPHEKNYGVSELEGLGVVWVIKHFTH